MCTLSRAWPGLILAALALMPRGAEAQNQGPETLPTSTFGNWALSATEDRGLQIVNHRRPEAVRLRFTHGSNGWFWVETTRDQYIMWSVGNFSLQNFQFDDGKPDANAPVLSHGTYVFGTWTVRVTANELLIDHPDNPHTVVLPLSSTGAIEIRGIRNQGNRVISPDDTLINQQP